jgi:hypothetical protein
MCKPCDDGNRAVLPTALGQDISQRLRSVQRQVGRKSPDSNGE